jgi:curved DNA-binding protein
MAQKDYYQTLGVPKTATPDEIKKAYRRLALKHHPDHNRDGKSAAAEEKFKEVNEAYQTLSDPDKRKKYDQFGADWERYEQAGVRPEDFARSRAGGPEDFRQTPFEGESSFSGADSDDLFEALFGQARGARGRGGRSVPRPGSDLSAAATITLDEAYSGTTRMLELEGQTIRVKIKPGSADDQVLKLAGKGGRGRNGGPNGDLYITITVAAHPDYERKGNDLYRTLRVELYTAVLGGKVEVPTLKGTVRMDIPRGTQSGKVLRLSGMGMPVYNAPNQFGNLYVTVEIQLPEHLSEAELALFQQLSDLRTHR